MSQHWAARACVNKKGIVRRLPRTQPNLHLMPSDGTFIAHYRYTSAKRLCDRKAAITTVQRGGDNFIQAIKALDGC